VLQLEGGEGLSIEMNQRHGSDESEVPLAMRHKPRDLDRPQRMLGVVLWLALVLVLMWMRIATR